jgi:polysaccharide deacetylase 2 family uncharacterized protein YibQ
MVKRLLILAVLVVGAWWYWTKWRPAQDYMAVSGRLEEAINQELTRSGLTDKNVVRESHREVARMGLTWVEFDRRFKTDRMQIKGLMDRLSQVARREGCRVMRREETKKEALLELGKGPFLMQRLWFVPIVPGEEKAGLPSKPSAALVIDDVAYEFEPMDRFAALGIPLTFAILPRDKHCKELANKAVGLHFPVILHLPMEPLDLAHNNPGSAGLYLNMTPEQLHAQFEKDVASVPHIQGINNHMGSAFTEQADKMALVLTWVKEKHLFFLDSHTSVHSVVPKVARQVGVECLVNETFLDNEDSAAAIEKQLDIVLHLALKRKQTIAIGHYRRKHLVEALAAKIPEFKAQGVDLVTLPSLYTKS